MFANQLHIYPIEVHEQKNSKLAQIDVQWFKKIDFIKFLITY